jgi:hypothetical protein
MYDIYTWLLGQVVVVASKPFYSEIPKGREQSRNIPPNCKTVPGALNRVRVATINVIAMLWALLAVGITGLIVVPLALSLLQRGGP